MMLVRDLSSFLQAVPQVERRVSVALDPNLLTIPSFAVTIETLQARLAPVPERAGGNGAAVLLLLYPRHDETMVLMTRRAASLRHHPREVSFPGGTVEPGESLTQAALRETYEEVGIAPSEVQLLGLLGSGAVRGTQRSFSGIVGSINALPVLRTNPDEVETILEVPLSIVRSGDYFCELWYSGVFGWGLFHFFAQAPDLIWGASARLLVDLLATLEP